MNYLLNKKPTIQDQGLTTYTYYLTEMNPLTKQKGMIYGPFDTIEEVNTYCKDHNIPFSVDDTPVIKA